PDRAIEAAAKEDSDHQRHDPGTEIRAFPAARSKRQELQSLGEEREAHDTEGGAACSSNQSIRKAAGSQGAAAPHQHPEPQQDEAEYTSGNPVRDGLVRVMQGSRLLTARIRRGVLLQLR